MKKTLLKSFTFFIIVISLTFYLDLLTVFNPRVDEFLGYLTNSTEFSRYHINTGTTQVIPTIENVQKKDTYTKLIIGDSVCCQLYNNLQPYNETYCIAGTNRAITLAGQYILAEEFVKNHPATTDIYLIITLDSLDAYFDATYGYRYAVMPFVKTDTFSLLDDNTIKTAEQIYGKVCTQKNWVNFIDYSSINSKLFFNYLESNIKAPHNEVELANNMATQYIQKMSLLCEENDINFHILPVPIADTAKRHDKLNQQIRYFEQTSISNLMCEYFDNIIFYPESQFADGIHMGSDYDSREKLNEKITDLQNKSNQLVDLNLELIQ